MIDGIKVVNSEELARVEKGGDGEAFMQQAGREVARVAMEYLEEHNLPKKVTLLVGEGNNGGDAYCAGICLLNAGVEVQALQVSEGKSPLNKKFGEIFRKKKGKTTQKMDGLILDGIFGTGFRGKVEGKIAKVIQEANCSGLPIIAIDIPSGLNGTTGEIGSIAIQATETVALGLPKMGFFLREGWNHVGRLRIVDFGLSKEAIAKADSVAYLPKRLELPKIVRNRHKYQAGYVIGFAGSAAMPGAAKLAGFAALKVGAGIVRVFHPEEIGLAPLELICTKWSEKAWQEALLKARAVFVGPGLGERKEWFKKHLKKIQLPCVIDADALLPDLDFPEGAILTPHRGEALRLLKLKTQPREEEFFAKIIRFCDHKQVIFVLKGAPTIIFGPRKKPVIITRGDPGMATAGTGDVLTGMIAGLAAQGMGNYESAILGVTLHGIAGEEAARVNTSYCLTATDLIDFLPAAFRAVMSGSV